ncbi:MAG: PAS domain-containing protein [Terriglobia bacterium]
MSSLRILLADDHELVRRGLRSLLALQPEWEICGEAVDGREAVDKAKELEPGLILLDVSMPRLSGLDAARLIRQENPKIEILFLSCHDSPGVVRAALDTGARGYVLKSELAEHLLAAVEAVSQHKPAFSPSLQGVTHAATPSIAPISGSEAESLRISKAAGPKGGPCATTKEFVAQRSQGNAAVFSGETGEGRSVENDSALPDIHESRQAEKALNEEQFHVLADSISQLAWMADRDGWIFWYNQRWYDYTGTTLEEMQGWGWQKVHHPDHLARVVERVTRSWETGEIWEDTFPLRGKDGNYRWFLSRALPVKDREGQVVRWFGTNTDVTEQRRTEGVLREHDRRLRAAFSLTYAFVLLLRPDGTVLEANRAALQGTGFARDEVIGRKLWEPWWSQLPKETEMLKAGLAKAVRGEMAHGSCYYCLHDGTKRYADCTLDPVKDESGHVVMIVATGLDVTEQRELRAQLEERVMQRTSELQEAERSLRELTAHLQTAQDEQGRRIARELHDSAGQSLTALSLNLALMDHKLAQNSPEAARLIKDSRQIMGELSKELRTISYLFHPPMLDEAGLDQALRHYVDGFAERSGIAVQLEIPPKLSRLPRDTEIIVFRIVQECLTNIHRHSESSSALVRITRDPQTVTLEVQDRGKGMAAAKGPVSGPAKPGVGILGMRERMRQLRGHLEIQSGAGGTTVRATFPFQSPSVSTPAVRSTQTASENPAQPA